MGSFRVRTNDAIWKNEGGEGDEGDEMVGWTDWVGYITVALGSRYAFFSAHFSVLDQPEVHIIVSTFGLPEDRGTQDLF